MNAATTTYADLITELRHEDQKHAPGSETAMWGDFVARMHELAREHGHDPRHVWELDAPLPEGEVDWWREAYRLLDEAGGDVEDMQALYDSVAI